MAYPSPLPPQASLLGPPVELRLQILELLLPNSRHHENYARCYTSITRVNNQLCFESIPIMYPGKIFEAELDDHVLSICAKSYQRPYWNSGLKHLPDRLRRIESLVLVIGFPVGGMGSRDLQKKTLLLITSLPNALAPSVHLKNLTISIELKKRATLSPWKMVCGTDEADLRSALAPFGQIRNLETALTEKEGFFNTPVPFRQR